MTEPLRIHLLGPFEIRLNGETLSNNHWSSQQTQTIAKLLITNRGRVVTSEKLIDILWPNESIESARSRLHVRISQFRNTLQEHKTLVQTVHGGYMFQPNAYCWLDVDEFQSQISEGAQYQETGQQIEAITAYEKAREIYRGDFLAEDLYADWTFNTRETFRENHISLLIELSECYAQQGRYRLAIARARHALVQDPLRETIYTRLMLYHYYAGERDQALRVFERCRIVLENELGVPPLDTTLNLFEQIKAGQLWKSTNALRYPPPIYEGRLFEVPYALTEIPLVSREREYAWLVSQWNDASEHVIQLEGEAGIGKSSLLNHFAQYLTSKDVRLLNVQLPPSEHRPTAAIVTALQSLLTESTLRKLSPATLAALAVLLQEIRSRVDDLPKLPPLSPNGEHQRLKQALTTLSNACAAKPTLLIVDDAQRLSPAAADLLDQLSKAFRVLYSFRSEEVSPDHPLRGISNPAGLKLAPLSLHAIQALISRLSGKDHLELATRIHTQSGGVPLFVVTLLQHMFETGYLFVNAGGDWETTSQERLTLPATLQATIEARLNHLNPAQRRIFDFAAIIGGKFNFNLLQAATQQIEESLLAAIDDLIESGLIIEPRSLGKPEFMISHDRYTEVAYETIPTVRRKGMHLQVAQTIEKLYARELDTFYPSLADHYCEAGKTDQAAHYAALAGEQAIARFASDEALQYLEMALALTPKTQPLTYARLRLARESVFDLHGTRTEQSEDLTELEAIAANLPVQLQAEIRLRRAAYEWILGNDENANAALLEAINLAQSCDAKEVEAKALLLAGRAATDFTQSTVYLERGLQIARQIKSRALEGDLIRCLGNAAFWQNQYAKSQNLFNQALVIHREVGDLRGELSALNNLGYVSELITDLPNALEYYDLAGEICRKTGDRLAEGVITTNLGRLTADLGNYTEAQSLFEKALIIRTEIANEEGLAMVHKNLGDLYCRAGQYGLALTQYTQAYQINVKIKHETQTFETLNALAALFRELGDYEQATSYLNQAKEIDVETDSHQNILFLINASLLNTLSGDPAVGLTLGKEALSHAQALPLLQSPAMKNIGHALLALGQVQEAVEYFQKACESYQANSQNHLAVEPLAGMAKTFLIQKNPGQAASLIEEILTAMDKQPLEGPDRPLWVYLICYQALTEVDDPRATQIINTAAELLQKRAEALPDERLRQSYLSGVKENSEILKIVQG